MIRKQTLEPSMIEREELSMNYLRQNCSYKLSDLDFNFIYGPILEQIGINSHAVMLFPKMAQSLKVDKILGEESLKKIVIAINHEILPDPKYADYLL